MKKLCVISMLILGIAGSAFCQKSKTDTLAIFEGISPPILSSSISRVTYNWYTQVKRNPNRIIINFGKKNLLKIDYQGTKSFVIRQNIDSLLTDFWNDYSLIRDTVNKNMVKKITYFGKNKAVNHKAVIEIQYFPQREVFQFGKEVELVRLKQDTLLLVSYNSETIRKEIVKPGNWAVKRYKNQSFLFNLNTIDDVEYMTEFNINQAIIEAGERIERERKTVKPWKSVNIENDVMNQKITNRIGGGRLYNYANLHADLGVGMLKDKFTYSSTVAVDFMSSRYFKKGITVGFQYNTQFKDNSRLKSSGTVFTGMTYYKRNKNTEFFKGGIFIGYSPTFNEATAEKGFNLKLLGWYQLTSYTRIQPEISLIEVNRTAKKTTFYPYNTGFRISFGI